MLFGRPDIDTTYSLSCLCVYFNSILTYSIDFGLSVCYTIVSQFEGGHKLPAAPHKENGHETDRLNHACR